MKTELMRFKTMVRHITNKSDNITKIAFTHDEKNNI